MRGRESIRVAFTIRRVALWWLLACCGVGAPTAAAVEDRLVASSTLLVFSGGQDAAAVMAQRDAFAAALRKSGNEQLGSDVAALRHWYLEAGPDDLFPLGVDQAYMATVLGDVIHNVTHTQVVVSFGPAASQVSIDFRRSSSVLVNVAGSSRVTSKTCHTRTSRSRDNACASRASRLFDNPSSLITHSSPRAPWAQ
jgi:hypothetical protein